jgi:N-acetylmuramoyl-L-alanine amidase
MTYTLITSHAGHTRGGGAYGCGYEESAVARQLNQLLIKAFKAVGQPVVDTTDNVGRTQSQNLNNLVRNCNAHPKNGRLDISLHLNAGGGTGVEVLYYDQRELAAKVSTAIAKVCGFKDRGPKQRKDLAVLKGTNAPAILIELCFIDNASDMAVLMSKMQEVANAIVQTITGKGIQTVATKTKVPKTGGFKDEVAIAKLVRFLLDRGWWAKMQTLTDGLEVETGGLNAPNLEEIESFFKQNEWWYEIKEV